MAKVWRRPPHFSYISLFSGIGGVDRGILQICPQARCAGYAETSPSCLSVYRQRFPHHLHNLGNVRDLGNLPAADLLVATPPAGRWPDVFRLLRLQPSSNFMIFSRRLDEARITKRLQAISAHSVHTDVISADAAGLPHHQRWRVWTTWPFVPVVGRSYRSPQPVALCHILDTLHTVRADPSLLVNRESKKASDTADTRACSLSLLRDQRMGKWVFRLFTTNESDRLRGFPAGWTSAIRDRTHRMHALHHSVPPAIASFMLQQTLVKRWD